MKPCSLLLRLTLAVLLLLQSAAFQSLLRTSKVSDSSLFMGKSRKARQIQKVEKQGKSRPNFFDAIDDAQDKPIEPKKKKKEKKSGDEAVSAEELEREARAEEARKRMDDRPEVSTMIVDEETGIEVIVQGKCVMDVVTRKAVKLSDLGPEYRLAQMFPGVPPDVRYKYRFDWKTVTVPQMVDALKEAASVNLGRGERGIPPHPSISSAGIDFVLANRDRLGHKMKRTLGRLQMRSMWLGNKKEASELNKLWKNFLTLENHISAPFRQMILDAEGRVGPNFGNLDVVSYCSGEIYERTANYLVLKGMVAHWEKKVVDADYIERTPQTKDNYITVLSRGDPRRYLPDPPILFTLKECTQVCAMSQQMTKAFVDVPELFDDLPVEIRFIEKALAIKGGTPLRKFVVDEFCPAEGITPEGLREGLRRLAAQLDNMQIDPYADITNILERLIAAMTVGTEDERDPYIEYLANTDQNGPGYFQTYTFNHEKNSLVRFLDSQYERDSRRKSDVSKEPNIGDLFNFGGVPDGQKQKTTKEPGIGDLFNFGGEPDERKQRPRKAAEEDEEEEYKVPPERAVGRPHNLGWLDLLKDEEDGEEMRLGKVPPGRIIQE